MVSRVYNARRVTFLHLLCHVTFFWPLFGELEEDRQRCVDAGGSLVVVRVRRDAETGVIESVILDENIDLDDDEVEERLTSCVPKNCVDLTNEWCHHVKGWLLRAMSDVIPFASKSEAPRGYEGYLAGVSSHTDWMMQGAAVHTMFNQFKQTLPDPELDIATRPLVNDGTQFRVAVVSHHAPLASSMIDHLRGAFSLVGQNPQFISVFYSACYLCEVVEGCTENHIPSQADRACELFQNPGEATFEDFYGIAQDVATRESDASVVMCFGLPICHFILSMLPPRVARIQLLCMNPLHGVPENLAGMMLLDLDRRLQMGEIILSTNNVTSALLSYHLGRASASVTLFRSDLFAWGAECHWEPDVKDVLLASSFLLQVTALFWVFRAKLMDLLPDRNIIEHMHNTTWSWSSQSDVNSVLRYALAVYIPEVPYKGYFNDLYAMRLPMFLPTLDFLSYFLADVASPDSDQPYHGWFDWRIPRTRLSTASFSGLPEPFDMRFDNKQKVYSWFQFADYYSFPGIQYFVGIADLVNQLQAPDLSLRLSDVRQTMGEHVTLRRAFALDHFKRVAESMST